MLPASAVAPSLCHVWPETVPWSLREPKTPIAFQPTFGTPSTIGNASLSGSVGSMEPRSRISRLCSKGFSLLKPATTAPPWARWGTSTCNREESCSLADTINKIRLWWYCWSGSFGRSLERADWCNRQHREKGMKTGNLWWKKKSSLISQPTHKDRGGNYDNLGWNELSPFISQLHRKTEVETMRIQDERHCHHSFHGPNLMPWIIWIQYSCLCKMDIQNQN